MPTFNSMGEFQSYVIDKCAAAVAETERKVHTVIDITLRKFYGEFTPREYIRTLQLMHSLVKSDVVVSGNSVTAEVYFDAGALNYKSPVRGYSGKLHSAKYSGAEVLDMAMRGSHGGYTNGTPIWNESHASLGNIYEILLQNLKSAGIPIK